MDNEGDHNEAVLSIKEENAAEASDKSDLKSNSDVAHILSEKFLQLFEPDLKRITDKLNDVTQNQTVLIESLSQEKNKLNKCSAVDEIECAMTKINLYRSKLNRIKKTMASLKEHSSRVHKDALKLQQVKQKEHLKQEDVRNKVLTREKSLVAQFSP